jgi:hypothetical protein
MIKKNLSNDTEKFALYDYIDDHGNNDIKKWTRQQEKAQRAKLNVRLDMLASKGFELFPEILTGTDTPGIQKLRVKGKIQLRLMLCKGPINHEKEFTLLIGATERDSCLVPNKADKTANDRKKIIIKNPNRRRDHERIS